VLASEGANVPDFTAEGKTFPALYWVATKRTSDGHVQLKLVNRSGSAQPIHVVLRGAHNVADTGTLTVLAGKDPGDSNSLDQPELIAPKRQTVHGLSRDFVQTVPAYSVSLLDFAAR